LVAKIARERRTDMRKLVTLAVALLTMTLLTSGVVSAAAEPEAAPEPAPETAVEAAPPQTPDQVTETTTSQTTTTTTAPEQNNPHSLASRNAAAMKLKAVLDKHNDAPGSQTK
jgi:hypothetical protein